MPVIASRERACVHERCNILHMSPLARVRSDLKLFSSPEGNFVKKVWCLLGKLLVKLESSPHTLMWRDICGRYDAFPAVSGVVRLILYSIWINIENTHVTPQTYLLKCEVATHISMSLVGPLSLIPIFWNFISFCYMSWNMRWMWWITICTSGFIIAGIIFCLLH